QGLQHRARDLARVGAGLVGGEVLGTVGDRQLAGVDGHLDGADVDERWQHDDLDLVGVEALELLAQLLDEREALLPVEVHLPVARHQRGAGGGHSESSSRMEMPGRSLPSMSSRLAPPPVEMCEKRDSSNPRVRTAAAESPPPATVCPAAVDRVSATAIVPLAKFSNSNTPMGPFQNTVAASAIFSPNSSAVSGPMSIPSWSAGISPTPTTVGVASAENSGAATV